ncbi:MAG: hypothetical protein E6R04_11625 [Spirochaetes bacterium]|nr:MAG: hypothetical protein E6R04_11625 [Spirochaetota bacterium]
MAVLQKPFGDNFKVTVELRKDNSSIGKFEFFWPKAKTHKGLQRGWKKFVQNNFLNLETNEHKIKNLRIEHIAYNFGVDIDESKKQFLYHSPSCF